MNIWGIEEYEKGEFACPIIPKNLSFGQKLVLFFFRFGICPMCITMSLSYAIGKVFKGFFRKSRMA
jgi:hypothetical protein